MPHKCMKCGAIYSDEGIYGIKSCSRCRGKFFIYAKTVEELMAEEKLMTDEEKLLGVSGEIEVKRIGDNVIVTKVGTKKDERINIDVDKLEKTEKKIEEKAESEIIEKESTKIPYIWDDKDYRNRISAKKEPIFVKSDSFKSEEESDKGLISLKREKQMSDLEWLEAMYGGKVDGVVSLDVETLRILRSGAYEIDIAGLMSYKPLILSPREGTFYIDLQSAMTATLAKKKRTKDKE